jgi:hypothetical protein
VTDQDERADAVRQKWIGENSRVVVVCVLP